MARRVHIAVFSVGLGHASRMDAVARELVARGFRVQFSCSGDAKRYLEQKGYVCEESPSLDLGWDETGGFSLPLTLKAAWRAPAIILRQIQCELRLLRQFKPHLILSDSRLSAIVAAAILRIPSLVVLNQVRIIFTPTGNTFSEKLVGEFLGKLWSLSKAILASDLPPPNTISAANLNGIRNISKKLHYTGFMIDQTSGRDPKPPDWFHDKAYRNLVFAPISGPMATKKTLRKIFAAAAPRLSQRFDLVISWGSPGAEMEPYEANNVIQYDWCPDRDWLIRNSSIVIARGGHGTISHAITYGKPMIIIPIPKQTEQEANAIQLVRLGVAIKLDQESCTPENLSNALQTVSSDPSFGVRASQLAATATKHNGVIEAVSKVVELVGD